MQHTKINIHIIVGARPNFMKAAPIYTILKQSEWANPILVHTGQHYDVNMSDVFFTDLGLPEPDHHLGIGGGTHADQLGKTMMAYETLCVHGRPDFVLVFGDVNATIACSLIASRMQIPCGHVEAGLRSGDRTMPEEINRILTDQIADLLWVPSADAEDNLSQEGIAKAKVKMAGNIMIDSLVSLRSAFDESTVLDDNFLEKSNYGVVTIHRPSNVDGMQDLNKIVDMLVGVAKRLKLVFPCHPRTLKKLQEFDLFDRLHDHANIVLLDPLGYKDFMALVSYSKCLITDSGGIQEETTFMGVPCLTVRHNTERPITIEEGTNTLTPPDLLPDNVIVEVDHIISGNGKTGRCPALWDGHAARRIADDIKEWFDGRA